MRNENIIYFTRVKYFTAYNWMLEICCDLVIRPDNSNVKELFRRFCGCRETWSSSGPTGT
jgi:hypothetical protein